MRRDFKKEKEEEKKDMGESKISKNRKIVKYEGMKKIDDEIERIKKDMEEENIEGERYEVERI